MAHPGPQEPEEVGEEALLLDDLEQFHEVAGPFFERVAGRRHLSICDSGLGFETDDDLPLSLSRSSTYTTSEDGEEIIDMEGEYRWLKSVKRRVLATRRGLRERRVTRRVLELIFKSIMLY